MQLNNDIPNMIITESNKNYNKLCEVIKNIPQQKYQPINNNNDNKEQNIDINIDIKKELDELKKYNRLQNIDLKKEVNEKLSLVESKINKYLITLKENNSYNNQLTSINKLFDLTQKNVLLLNKKEKENDIKLKNIEKNLLKCTQFKAYMDNKFDAFDKYLSEKLNLLFLDSFSTINKNLSSIKNSSLNILQLNKILNETKKEIQTSSKLLLKSLNIKNNIINAIENNSNSIKNQLNKIKNNNIIPNIKKNNNKYTQTNIEKNIDYVSPENIDDIFPSHDIFKLKLNINDNKKNENHHNNNNYKNVLLTNQKHFPPSEYSL